MTDDIAHYVLTKEAPDPVVLEFLYQILKQNEGLLYVSQEIVDINNRILKGALIKDTDDMDFDGEGEDVPSEDP